jgi:quinolinate synthase
VNEYLRRLVDRLNELKERRRAVILAHNYTLPEIQDAADFVGDSLELAIKAAETSADVIVLAGVRFMAEVAKLLNPDRIVLHPDLAAGCPLADFASPRLIRDARKEYPGAPVVIYVNSYAAAKAESDYVVTSASAVEAVKRLEAETVLFAPDKNLADWVQENNPDKRVIPVPRNGHCPVHEYLVSEYYVRKAKEEHPAARVLIHPEAPRSARRLADYVGSTSQMLRYIGQTDPRGEYILGTEEGLAYRAKRLYPEARVYPVSPRTICIDMKKITLDKVVSSLESLKPRIEIDPAIAKKAREAVERGLELVGKKPR